MAAPRITKSGENILVYTPWLKTWPPRAHCLGGEWKKAGSYWLFPIENEQAIRKALKSVFGTDGSDPVYLVMALYDFTNLQEVKFRNLTVARRPSVGSKIYHSEEVEILTGGYVRDYPEAVIGPNDLSMMWLEEHSTAELAVTTNPHYYSMYVKRPTAPPPRNWQNWNSTSP